MKVHNSKGFLTRRVEINIDTPVKQWVASFLFFDAIVWSLAIIGLIASGGTAAEGVLFMFPIFYAPFWLFIPDMGNVGGLGVNNLAMPIVGIFFHAVLGVVVGKMFKNREVDTFTSKVVAFFILLALIVISFVALDAYGYFI